MRVLFTTGTLDPIAGGPARSVPGLAAGLSAAGAEVEIWVNEFVEGRLNRGEFQGRVIKQPNEIAAWKGFDLIHDHGIWLPANHRTARIASKLKSPLAISPRGMLEPWALKHRRWKKLAAWWCYQRNDLRSATLLHATSTEEALQLRRLGLRNPIATLPNGVDLPDPAVFEDTPHSENERTAIFLSRLHPKKGLPMLVKAWAEVRPQGWRMLVVGPSEGGHRELVQRMLTEHGIAGDWEFRDAVDGAERWRLLANSELMILPTYSENFGIAIAEALGVGTPVLTTTGTPWRGLEQHRCGWWINPDVASLASALETATRMNRQELKAMGAAGRSWMAREFTWPSIAQQMLAAYRWALGQGDQPTCVSLE